MDTVLLGEESAPPLLLLHAGGMTRREWDPHLVAWSRSFRLIVPTALGHGGSARTERLTFSGLVDSTLDLLDRLGIPRAHVLGSSMGGGTALRIALRHPERVHRLVLYRTGYRNTSEMRGAIGRLADCENWRRWGMERWMIREHLPQGGPEAWKEVISRVAALVDPSSADASVALDDLGRIENPTLLIAGDRDDLAPLNDLLAMFRTLPSASLWIVPRAGHILGMESWRKEAFQEEVRRFLLRG